MDLLSPSGSFVSLIVSDLAASVHFYVEVLGFEQEARGSAPGGFADAAQILWPGGLRLWLLQDRRRPPLEEHGGGTSLYFPVSGSLTEWAGRLPPTEITVMEPVLPRPGGYVSLTLADPDWYRLVFYGSA